MKKSTIRPPALATQLRRHRESGMTTAEYAVGTIPACAFAAVLLAVLQSGAVQGLVNRIITTALSVIL
jgi:hypothetical protein